ncbi:unnamed protein product [uncultured bacterium]|nr:unnamed protein product [uncultured bacterium]
MVEKTNAQGGAADKGGTHKDASEIGDCVGARRVRDSYDIYCWWLVSRL